MSLIRAIKHRLGLSVTPANNFYVYAHCKQDGSPYYIGKGRRDRYLETRGRSNFWRKCADKHGINPIFIAKNLTEQEAYSFEKILVEKLGKRTDATGILVNIVDGGRGVIGLKHSDESKAVMSIKHTGKKLSAEHRKKMSDTQFIVQNDPQVKARLVAIRNTDEFKKQAAEKAAAKWADPDHRAKMAEIKRKQWADPTYRQSMMTARKDAAERRAACL